MTTFKLPDLGEGLQEAEVVAWHVGLGDHVVADQPPLSPGISPGFTPSPATS
jgi:pyruvate dehydrogenase E2 component (dihydrolipoamide acetyltransferase)